MSKKKIPSVKTTISRIMKTMTSDRGFGEAMTQMGVSSVSAEGKTLRRNYEKKRAGTHASTPVDVLALLCMQEVAAGNMRLEDYREQIDTFLPASRDYKDERVQRWALSYVLYKTGKLS